MPPPPDDSPSPLSSRIQLHHGSAAGLTEMGATGVGDVAGEWRESKRAGKVEESRSSKQLNGTGEVGMHDRVGEEGDKGATIQACISSQKQKKPRLSLSLGAAHFRASRCSSIVCNALKNWPTESVSCPCQLGSSTIVPAAAWVPAKRARSVRLREAGRRAQARRAWRGRQPGTRGRHAQQRWLPGS